METTDHKEKNTHHGHAVKRFRRSAGMKQETLAAELGVCQATISLYESKKEIDDQMLEKFAKALGVSVDMIKELEEDPVTIIIENNTITNENNEKVTNAGYLEDNSVNHFNPVDKIVELCEKILAADKEKIALLEKLLKEKK